MSWLFPLYAAGALAIGLPLLFHLIQRRPRGQTPFSSLMFLRSSPPRLTRRRRLDNLLLLLLRALALLLLAAAFTRPLWRSFSLLDLNAPARRIVVLLDTSASMQREGAWRDAVAKVEKVLADIRPADQFALYAFDSTTRPLLRFEDATRLPAGGRKAALRTALRGASPTWNSTNLGQALVVASDQLQTGREGAADQGVLPPQIVLVTDLQQGSDLEALDGYQWPEETRLDVQRVTVAKTTNASLVVLPGAEDALRAAPSIRVRVSNATDSQRQQFRLGWADSEGALIDGREYALQVPPGQQRVAKLNADRPDQHRLVLIGDDQAFDNTRYVAQPLPLEKTLLYVGDDGQGKRGLLHYLKMTPLDTPWQSVQVRSRAPDQPLADVKPAQVPLIVVDRPVAGANVEPLRKYVSDGGRLLLVLSRPHGQTAEDMTSSLRQLTGLRTLEIEEAAIRDYAMLARIDFRHPLFQPMADPRFSDFTKIHFWAHRVIQCSHEQPWEVLARFDDQSPALVERLEGQGRLWILTSGWQPDESEFAISTKFVPLIAVMFNPTAGRTRLQPSYDIGQPLQLPKDWKTVQVELPDGTRVALGDDGEKSAWRPSEPGLYQLLHEQSRQPVAVNLAASESLTAPLDAEQLEQRGVKLGKARTVQEIQDQQRQMRDMELESQQKLWRLLIVAALSVLLLETILGGWLQRRPDPTAA